MSLVAWLAVGGAVGWECNDRNGNRSNVLALRLEAGWPQILCGFSSEFALLIMPGCSCSQDGDIGNLYCHKFKETEPLAKGAARGLLRRSKSDKSGRIAAIFSG